MSNVVATPAASTAPKPASPWFHSPWFDLLLILGVPFVTWPLVSAGQDRLGAAQLNLLIALTATGHYCATFVRAYGDRDLFARFRTRFLVVPLLLLVTTTTLFHGGHGPALLLVTAGWAFWHWLAQAFGFARIYDIKAGSFHPRTALLDKALVVTGFVAAVTLNQGSIATFAKLFLDAGIALPTAEQFAPVQWTVRAACVLVGTAYVMNLAAAIVRGQPWSWQKQFMHATTIGYYWFSFAWLDNVLIAYVLYELFHDLQYYAITWLTCRQRARRPGVTVWFGVMFGPGVLGTLVFLATMTAFGAADYFGRPHSTPWLGVFLTLALLHYYYDGFIWKAREQALGNDLGIAGGLRATVVPGLRHAALWALFAVPLAGAIALGGAPLADRARAESLAALAPGDFVAQTELAYELVRASDLAGGIAHYRAAVVANPDYARARANLGNVLEHLGDFDGAREQYERALACRDSGDCHRLVTINLGVLTLLRGDRGAAETLFARGRELGGESPVTHMLAVASQLPEPAGEQRRQLWAAALQLDPNLPDAHFGLGSEALAQRNFNVALRHLTALQKLAPEFVPGLVALAATQTELGQFDAARATVAHALQREPGNAAAQALQARLRQ
ncbi:MAG: tetratricopeptide repeat protein [Planctomycetota bacterium]